jgi:hypothetical protein
MKSNACTGITNSMRSRKHAQTRPSPVPVALLLIDVITTFPDGGAILQHALAMLDALVRLKTRARQASMPVLYVNDNFGDWRSEKEVLIQGNSDGSRTCRMWASACSFSCPDQPRDPVTVVSGGCLLRGMSQLARFSRNGASCSKGIGQSPESVW